MKFFTILSFCFFAVTIQAQLWNCDCEIDFNEEYICAVDSDGLILPVPNQCFADCLNLTVLDEEDCIGSPFDSIGWGDFPFLGTGDFLLDCDCPSLDSLNEGICIEIDFANGFPEAIESIVIGLDIDFSSSFVGWLPNECYAQCLGLTEYNIIDCDSIDFETFPCDSLILDDPWNDCGCDDSDWDGDGLCIEVTFADSLFGGLDTMMTGGGFEFPQTFETWVPSECFAACWGYTEYVVVACDSIWEDDWEDDWDDPWNDCGCDDADWDGDGLCIEVTFADSLFGGLDTLMTGGGFEFPQTFETWVPSECFAACWGYTDYVVVDCDSIWEDDWDDDWDDPWNDCGCDDADWDGDGLCIEVTFADSLFGGLDTMMTGGGFEFPQTFETWVPSECFAACWGYTDYVVVACDSIWEDDWDDDWDDPWNDCGCDDSDWDGDGLCIEVTYSDSLFGGLDTLITGGGFEFPQTFQTWVPSECFAACWGYTDYVVVACDSIWEDDWDDPWNDCGCDDSDWDGDGLCIEVTYSDSLFGGLDSTIIGGVFELPQTFETWVPSECFAACWGYTDYEIVACDSIIYDDPWEDCDCDYNDEDEMICVLTDPLTGEICPFPNLCYAECAGYSLADVVDCSITLDLNCLDCINEEIDPVCVIDSSGNIFPVPNLCIAECLGFTIIEDGSCGDLTDGDTGNGSPLLDIVTTSQLGNDELGQVIDYRIFPNPASDIMTLSLEMRNEAFAKIIISDVTGKLVKEFNQPLVEGLNSIELEIGGLEDGSYILSVLSAGELKSERFVKF